MNQIFTDNTHRVAIFSIRSIVAKFDTMLDCRKDGKQFIPNIRIIGRQYSPRANPSHSPVGFWRLLISSISEGLHSNSSIQSFSAAASLPRCAGGPLLGVEAMAVNRGRNSKGANLTLGCAKASIAFMGII